MFSEKNEPPLKHFISNNECPKFPGIYGKNKLGELHQNTIRGTLNIYLSVVPNGLNIRIQTLLMVDVSDIFYFVLEICPFIFSLMIQ